MVNISYMLSVLASKGQQVRKTDFSVRLTLSRDLIEKMSTPSFGEYCKDKQRNPLTVKERLPLAANDAVWRDGSFKPVNGILNQWVEILVTGDVGLLAALEDGSLLWSSLSLEKMQADSGFQAALAA